MKARLKNFGVLLLLTVLALVALDHFLPMDRVISIVLDVRPWYLVLASFLIVAGIVVNAYVYRVLLGTFGYSAGFAGLVGAILKSDFVGNTIPSMGVSGLAVLDYHFRREGVDSKVSKRILILKNVANAVSTLIILVFGFILLMQGTITRQSLIVPGVLTVVVVAGILYTGYLVSEIERLRRLVRRLESLFGRLIRPAGPRLRRIADEVAEGVRYARNHRSKLAFPVFCNLLGMAILAVTVYVLFLGLETGISFGSVVIGFITATWIGAASMLPGGVGAFEATMAASYSGVGVGIEQAAAVVLLFRVMSFWIPTAVGGILTRKELKEIRDHIKSFVS